MQRLLNTGKEANIRALSILRFMCPQLTWNLLSMLSVPMQSQLQSQLLRTRMDGGACMAQRFSHLARLGTHSYCLEGPLSRDFEPTTC